MAFIFGKNRTLTIQDNWQNMSGFKDCCPTNCSILYIKYNNEVVVIPDSYHELKIATYNVINDQWQMNSVFLNINTDCYYISACLDEQNEHIWIYKCPELMIYNIYCNKLEDKIIDIPIVREKNSDRRIPLFCVHKNLHLFDLHEGIHWMYDTNAKQLKKVAALAFIDDDAKIEQVFYIKSKNIFLFFGDLLFEYDLTTQKYKHIKMPLRLYKDYSAILTNDAAYIIMFGGAYSTGHRGYINTITDDIFVLNIQEMKFYKTIYLKGYKSGLTKAVITNNKIFNESMLKIFIRKAIGNHQSDIYPVDVIKLIVRFATMDYVHLLCSSSHAKIPLNDILKNLISI